MATQMIETCDVCGEDVRHLSFNGGTWVYRGRFRKGGWFYKGHEERPPGGTIAICLDCWRQLGQAVRDRRAAESQEEAPDA